MPIVFRMSARTLARVTWALVIAAGIVSFGSHPARAAGNPEYQCQSGRMAAAAKYAQCELKTTGSVLVDGDLGKYVVGLAKCRIKYAKVWVKLQAKALGTGSSCEVVRFTVGGGIVTDNLTGLQWEQKTNDSSIHDTDDLYSWTAGGPGGTAPDGTAFTTFLATLNGSCFAGNCDWRLPTRAELATILLPEPYPCATNPCIDQATFGPVGAPFSYWSDTSFVLPSGLQNAWHVAVDDGLVDIVSKHNTLFVRAVRGGL